MDYIGNGFCNFDISSLRKEVRNKMDTKIISFISPLKRNLKMKKIFKTAIISSCFFLGLTIIIAYFISDNFFDQISNNAGASLNFALKILMLGFVFSIVYHGMAKFLNKIFGVVNNKNNENT